MDANVSKAAEPAPASSSASNTKLILGGIVMALLILGVGLGVGLGIKNRHHSHKSSHSSGAAPATAPALSPNSTATANTTTTNTTRVKPPVTRTVPKAKAGQNQTQILRDIGTNSSSMTAQSIEDADTLTTELATEFVQLFIELVKDSGAAKSDVQVLQDNQYLLVRYLKARQVDKVLEVMRELAEAGDNPSDALLDKIVDTVLAAFDGDDFQKWLDGGAKDYALTSDQMTQLAALDAELEADAAAHPPPAPYPNDPILQLAYFEANLKEIGATNSSVGRRLQASGGPAPRWVGLADMLEGARNGEGRGLKATKVTKNLGFAKFKRVKIGLVFHVMQFTDSKNYLYPISAYQEGSSLVQKMVAEINALYDASGMNLQFYVHEYRSDVDKYEYLWLGNRDAWQKCANTAEACTCPQAKKHNVQPNKYINIYLAGSYSYPGLSSSIVGYTSNIPAVLDSCSADGNYDPATTPSTRHLWIIYDCIDPKSSLLDTKYNEGAATLAHELGHFLGLLHTHEGDCANQDAVADTSANLVCQDQPYGNNLYKWCDAFRSNKNPSRALLKAFDSCKKDKLIDNVFNIMSYIPAPCNLYFTPGQVRRLQGVVLKYNAAMLQPV